jgi:hypothetical protein
MRAGAFGNAQFRSFFSDITAPKLSVRPSYPFSGGFDQFDDLRPPVHPRVIHGSVQET